MEENSAMCEKLCVTRVDWTRNSVSLGYNERRVLYGVWIGIDTRTVFLQSVMCSKENQVAIMFYLIIEIPLAHHSLIKTERFLKES